MVVTLVDGKVCGHAISSAAGTHSKTVAEMGRVGNCNRAPFHWAPKGHAGE